MDSLISTIEKLQTAKIDSIYDGRCEDCGGFIIKIITMQNTISSMIIGANEFHNQLADFAHYVTDIKIKPNKIDSIYIFETTKYLIVPELKAK